MNRKTNNNILVPTDFSEIAGCALDHAIKIAKAYKNEITLLNVIDEGGFLGIFGKSQTDLMKIGAETQLKNLATQIESNNNIRVNCRIETGKIYKTIANIANSENFDSVVMGSSGASGLEQIIGSNASRTIALSQVPVVVVKQAGIGEGYKNIVLPIDLTIETRQKVEWAIHIAKKFNSHIHVVYSNSSDEFVQKRILANISNVEFQLKESGVLFSHKELEDKTFENFGTEVLTYAEYTDADLILVMTQESESISDFVIGTLTQQLVNRSERIPIMCIHPKETGFTFDY